MARLLKERGADVIVCDIKEDRVKALCERYGLRSVHEAEHLDEPCDIYAPCARGAGINDETIPRLTCTIVAGCANNMLLEPRHGDELRKRGILYAPDYVVNAAGIINVSVERHEGGYDEEVAMAKIHTIADNLEEVFQLADERDIGTHTAARLLAELRIERARQQQGG
jgi:leucine dehydrogenase